MSQPQGQSNQFNARLASDTAWTNATLKAAPGADRCIFITDIVVNGGATARTFSILDGSGGTVLYKVSLGINGWASVQLKTPIRLTVNTLCALTSSGASVGAFVGINGFVALNR